MGAWQETRDVNCRGWTSSEAKLGCWWENPCGWGPKRRSERATHHQHHHHPLNYDGTLPPNKTTHRTKSTPLPRTRVIPPGPSVIIL